MPTTEQITSSYQGSDGKPCKVCTSFKSWSRTLKGEERNPDTSNQLSSKKISSTDQSPIENLTKTSEFVKDCPVDSERLGRHTWTFLHTTASYYPSQPNQLEKRSMSDLLNALTILYPCKDCANDLKVEIDHHPPDLSSREALERWMCETHNEVNRRLGKPEFDCSTVSQRWRDGWKDGRCDN